MKHILEQISNKSYVEAETSIKEQLYIIAESKINELKKMMACSEQFMKTANQKKVAMDVLEQQTDADDEKQAHMNVAMNRLKKMMEQDIPAVGTVKPLKMNPNLPSSDDVNKSLQDLKRSTDDSAGFKQQQRLRSGLSQIAEEDSIEEAARVGVVKVRIRGGQIQRRKKVSNVAGYTLRGGQLTRMTAAERRRRKLGAKRANIKKRGQMTRILMKRKRSLQKKKRLGL